RQLASVFEFYLGRCLGGTTPIMGPERRTLRGRDSAIVQSVRHIRNERDKLSRRGTGFASRTFPQKIICNVLLYERGSSGVERREPQYDFPSTARREVEGQSAHAGSEGKTGIR